MRSAIALVLALLPLSAQAEEAKIGYYSLEASSSCVTSSEFATSFAQRSRSVELSMGNESSPIRVRFEEKETNVIAELSIRLEDGSVVKRRLEAKNCFEAREAMAFVLVLALDPEDLEETPPPRAPAPDPEPKSGRPPSGGEKPRDEASRLGFGFGLLGAGTFGLTPEPALGAGIGFEVTKFRSEIPKGPSLRFEVRHAVALDRVSSVGTAHFETSTLSLSLCPFELSLGEFRLRPCGSGTFGVLAAEGRNTRDGGRHVSEFGAFGAHLFADFPLGRGARLGVSGGGLVPLRRDSYQFDSTVFFTTEAVVFDAGLGIFFFFG